MSILVFKFLKNNLGQIFPLNISFPTEKFLAHMPMFAFMNKQNSRSP